MAKKPKIAFLGTGGTISYTGRNSLDVWEYMDFGTRLSVSEILSRFPEVKDSADIIPIDVRQVSSSGIRWFRSNSRHSNFRRNSLFFKPYGKN